MADKKRVYELAKEQGMPAKEMVELLNKEFGLGIKSHMSNVSGDNLELISEYFKEENNNPATQQNKNKDNKTNMKKDNSNKYSDIDDYDDDRYQSKQKFKKSNKSKKNKNFDNEDNDSYGNKNKKNRKKKNLSLIHI